MNEKVMIQVHENIKKYRKLNNMTQEKLAAALEMDPQYYAQLERGERNFSLEKNCENLFCPACERGGHCGYHTG